MNHTASLLDLDIRSRTERKPSISTVYYSHFIILGREFIKDGILLFYILE